MAQCRSVGENFRENEKVQVIDQTTAIWEERPELWAPRELEDPQTAAPQKRKTLTAKYVGKKFFMSVRKSISTSTSPRWMN